MELNAMRSQRGLSLIEVLVALSVLAISLLALVPLFTISAKTNASAGQLASANTLAREKLEELICYPSTDSRLQIPAGGLQGTYTNDLPGWYNPATGGTATGANPGAGWYPYPYRRTYTVQAFLLANMVSPEKCPDAITSEAVYTQPNPPTPYYDVKLVTVTVQPIMTKNAGKDIVTILPGWRTTTQSAYVKFRTP